MLRSLAGGFWEKPLERDELPLQTPAVVAEGRETITES